MRARAIALIVLIITFDQITKLYFHTQFTYLERVNVLP
ncbi:MAG: signal peptidase II, partial [Betaproteobacteria bacterium]